MHLDELNVPGFIRFSIKAKDTEGNQRVHDMFREFCKVEVDDNYTLGLKKLLEYYAEDYKFESLHLMIEELKAEIDELRTKIDKKKDDTGLF